MGKKHMEVNLPNEIDAFGKLLDAKITQMRPDRLRPALMEDIIAVTANCIGFQQLLVLFYNISVENHVALAEKLAALETRCAGYSSEINELQKQIKILKGEI